MENNANITSTSIDYKICLKNENIMVSHEKHMMKNPKINLIFKDEIEIFLD